MFTIKFIPYGLAKGQPITLFIPPAVANDINSKNYIVPDLATNTNINQTSSQVSANSPNQNTQLTSISNPIKISTTSTKRKIYKKIQPREQEALNISHAFYNAPASVIQGANGAVTFIYGQSQPTIICAVLHVCMIELQAGEIIQEERAGDTNRWEITPTASTVPYIAIKPLIKGNFETNYIIITNKRRYSFTLKTGANNKYMSVVNFTYPENAQEQWNKYYKLQNLKQSAQQNNVNNAYVPDGSNFDFNYIINGSSNFKPTQVYTDGKKTYIKLPESINNSELPIFHAETSSGRLKAVNARFINGQYIIDQKIEKGKLKAGSGNDKEEISITYNKASRPNFNYNER